MEIKKLMGDRVKDLRLKKKFTQERLSEDIGINPKYLSSIERGKENPTLNMLIKLAVSLDVEMEQLFSYLQYEDPVGRKNRIINLIEKANDEQLKTIEKICNVLII
jgi:transcriptional regulator with XRE-family HTH domain